MKRLVILSAVLIVLMWIGFKYVDHSDITNLFTMPFQSEKSIEINPNYQDRISIDLIAKGLSLPTSMTFVGNNSILVLEKDRGNVRLISNGVLQKDPIYTVENISNEKERGLLGIAALDKSKVLEKIQFDNDNHKFPTSANSLINTSSSLRTPHTNDSTFKIYLYVTEKTIVPSSIYNNTNQRLSETTHNRVYEYNWNGSGNGNLSNPTLLLDLPSGPDPFHNGGKMHLDKQGNLYIIIGDLVTINNTLQNYPGGKDKSISAPNNSSVIIRINPLSESIIPNDNPFYSYYDNNTTLHSMKLYYSYGIRNGFGLDTDPLTGKLWDTENGESNYDEINLVQPGSNSGWNKIMGPFGRSNNTLLSDLVLLNGSHYSDPEFSWRVPVGVTDIEFLESSHLGNDLENNIFVGDINNGNVYLFKVNSNRTGIDLQKSIFTSEKEKGLQDLVADNKNELEKIIFAKNFEGRITDIETGTDGSLYILTYFDGRIYKISATER
ncbi:MAG: sorbosone dehydrogenase family protein [Candidatus Nitrosocosmicus sp.]|jgi:glucose/arabinose dehydrogenase|uniref:PQQ-dependent sugar dehydrogenase n=1 Tax=Candidatus Nitrosocosmicus sp. FF01 TaxID=3397670 RepID=UPI002A6E580E|nr:quinoprotein glucose dehydrogenase [Candidatus Nitrosocosmicus sp.]